VPASCPRCKAAVVPGTRNCQFCGAPVEYVEPPAAESRQSASPSAKAAPQKPPSPSPAPVAAARTPAKPGKGGKKPVIYYVIPGVVCLLGIVLVFYIAIRLQTVFSGPGSGNQSPAGSAEQPQAGTASTAATAAGLGIDIYPGARQVSDQGRDDSSDSLVLTATFVSSDEMDKVINFYKARMVGYASIYADGAGVVVSITRSAKDSIRVGIWPAKSGGKTQFSITHTTGKASK
jgi:hypothetical protein